MVNEHNNLTEQIATLTAERDEARKELASLRSAPGMEDVESILNDVNSSVFANQERLSNIARQAIASRDEVVGLLTTAVESITGVREALENVVAYKFHALKADATRILEVVEGK